MLHRSKFHAFSFALAIIAIFTLIGAGPAAAASNRSRMLAGATAAMTDQRTGPNPGGPWGMSEAEWQGAGCLASGVAATAAAYATNANEVVMVVAGGIIAPSTPLLLGIVMLSTVFTSGCAVGAIAAPFGYWLVRQAPPSVVADAPPAAPPAETPR